MKLTPASVSTILVVEDEPLVRWVGSLLLADAGFNVIEACNAEEALRVLETSQGVNIVFTDIEMPGALNGLGLARCIHERWPSIGVVVTSGRCQEQIEPGQMFVAKPYGLKTLIPKIKACLSAAAIAA